ncbi:hypothetical protein [Candidatus Tisiphia endosymbiont of Nemotelus uliginosus]|uniref:hypothetical protein n=1 Tax=Candidatus Tisiphia endosymbiont of Nemotelus uliginosus TaxID=3077926 RepID=UPI0035C9376D
MRNKKQETELKEKLTLNISCKDLINILIDQSFLRDHDYCANYPEKDNSLVSDPIAREKVLDFLQLIDTSPKDIDQDTKEHDSNNLTGADKNSWQEKLNRYKPKDVKWAIEMVYVCASVTAELTQDPTALELMGNFSENTYLQ